LRACKLWMKVTKKAGSIIVATSDEQRLATNNPHNLTRHLNPSVSEFTYRHESSDRDKVTTKNRTQLSPKIKGAIIITLLPPYLLTNPLLYLPPPLLALHLWWQNSVVDRHGERCGTIHTAYKELLRFYVSNLDVLMIDNQ